MNMTRPDSHKVSVDQFEDDLSRLSINRLALTASSTFRDMLVAVPSEDRPDWFNDIIESDAPSRIQIMRAESKILFEYI